LFTESMGNVASTTTIAQHESNNGFDNDNFTMSGNSDIRSNTFSTGYGTGLPTASGLANVFITNTAGTNFTISGINTSGFSNLQLSFGIYKSTTTGTGSDLLVKVSSDGTNFTTLSYPALPTGTATWNYRVATGTIPAVPNLRIQFVHTGATTTQYRIDDVLLKYTSVPVITASGPTTFCLGDSVTLTASAGNNYQWSTGEITQSIVVKNSGNYSVLVNCVSSANTVVNANSCTFLNLKVFIQGFYTNNDRMRPALDPDNKPSICDSITVELHDTTASYALVGMAKDTINTSGNGKFRFYSLAIGRRYYIVVKGRNSLETWSKQPVLFTNPQVNFDFTRP